MTEKKYLIYIDILGFEALAKELSEKTGFQEDVIRQNYLSDPLEKKIEEVKRERIQVSRGISEIEGSDNYVLIVDDIQTAFEIVGKVTSIKIPHRDYQFIPLEIALGTERFDEEIEVKPINRKEIITFLKNDIINPYRNHYKKEHKDKIKETFVLFTPEFFNDLEPLDKKYCKKISYQEKTFFVSDSKKIQQRCEVFEFLNKIGFAGSKLYDRIDDLYVPPLEYKEIKKVLEKDRIVFITGTAEYGKTYTAVRLLWEYFGKGYEANWIKGGEEKERMDVRKRLEEIERELKPQHIVYFEDPFGKTRYERRESLEREIGTIIECVKNVEHVYVIITSREEVFKKFEKEHLSSVELRDFERKLNIRKPSYDFGKREKILLSWAEAKDCKWLEHDNLKNMILEYVKDPVNLPTPLSIKDFVISTVDIAEGDKLGEKIREKSKETAKSFAEEIESMTHDKVLFLSFLFISDNFKVNFVRAEYERLVKELKIERPSNFDRILDWFKDDKVTVRKEKMRFSHPSYSEALEHLLVDKKGRRKWINEAILAKVLSKLSEKDEAGGAVGRLVANNFNKLAEEERNLLFKLAEQDEAAGIVAEVVAGNFNKLPEKVRNELLLKLSEKDKAAGTVAQIVAGNFNELPEKVRDLLLKVSEKDKAAWGVAWAVRWRFSQLPDRIRNELLFRLSEKDKVAGTVAEVVARNFNKLPEKARNELLLKLSEREAASWSVVRVVRANLNKLPEKVRDELLFKLSKKNEAAREVAQALRDNFYKLPEKLRYELLLKLSERDQASRDVAWAVRDNFDKLPDKLRNELLFKLSEKDEAAEGVAWTVADNFNKLPEKLRNELLLKLSRKDEAAEGVAWAARHNFDKLSDKLKNLLDKFRTHL